MAHKQAGLQPLHPPANCGSMSPGPALPRRPRAVMAVSRRWLRPPAAAPPGSRPLARLCTAGAAFCSSSRGTQLLAKPRRSQCTTGISITGISMHVYMHVYIVYSHKHARVQSSACTVISMHVQSLRQCASEVLACDCRSPQAGSITTTYSVPCTRQTLHAPGPTCSAGSALYSGWSISAGKSVSARLASWRGPRSEPRATSCAGPATRRSSSRDTPSELCAEPPAASCTRQRQQSCVRHLQHVPPHVQQLAGTSTCAAACRHLHMCSSLQAPPTCAALHSR
jgi:hypothetical protein